MRKGCRSIKSRAILGIALILSRGRIPSPQENSSTISGLIEYFLPLYIFFSGAKLLCTETKCDST
jgi:mannitol-specific phosphotransferase system IIBC component